MGPLKNPSITPQKYFIAPVTVFSRHRGQPALWCLRLGKRTYLDCRSRRSGATGLRPPARRSWRSAERTSGSARLHASRAPSSRSRRAVAKSARRLAVRNVAGNMATLRPDGMKQVNGEGCRGRHSLLSVAQVQAYVDSYGGRDVNPPEHPPGTPLGRGAEKRLPTSYQGLFFHLYSNNYPGYFTKMEVFDFLVARRSGSSPGSQFGGAGKLGLIPP